MAHVAGLLKSPRTTQHCPRLFHQKAMTVPLLPPVVLSDRQQERINRPPIGRSYHGCGDRLLEDTIITRGPPRLLSSNLSPQLGSCFGAAYTSYSYSMRTVIAMSARSRVGVFVVCIGEPNAISRRECPLIPREKNIMMILTGRRRRFALLCGDHGRVW